MSRSLRQSALLLAALASSLLAVTAAAQSPGQWGEAESARRTNVSVASSAPGYSGTGYAKDFDQNGAQVEFTFYNITPGRYRLDLRYAVQAGFGDKGYDLVVDGASSSGIFPNSGGWFLNHDAGTFGLSGSSARVTVKKGWGYYHLDAARLVRVASAPTPPRPTDPLSDRDASAETKALFQYLKSEYGTNVLSGQQTLADLNYVKAKVGRTPAVGSFDFMEYSPDRVRRGNARPEATTQEIIDWAGPRGIVSVAWHWNSPTRVKEGNCNDNNPCWWGGFYTNNTDFNLRWTLDNPSSASYRALIADIDAIAVQLQTMENARLPVLWRPLHEASGGWFWWGSAGPTTYKRLWRLMYRRLVDDKGLHNLIWVYTSEGNDADWYPGVDVVDIISRDTYANKGNPFVTQERLDWDYVRGTFGDRKMVALSESGALPVASNRRDQGVWWSWFSVWNGDFIRDISDSDLRAVYDDDRVLTRGNVPYWRTSSASAPLTSALAAVDAPALGVAVSPNPARGPVTARVSLDAPAEAVLSVYDTVGRRVLVQSLGALDAGIHPVPLDTSSLPAGLYVVRLDGTATPVSTTFVVAR